MDYFSNQHSSRSILLNTLCVYINPVINNTCIIHLSTGSCSWYNTKACSPCNCYDAGSVNMNCDKDGKCSCKPGFKGKKCSDKDCVMSPWRWESTCQCGPGKTRKRSRYILSHPHGKGNPCGKETDIDDCNLKCQCKSYQSGDYCEHQNCVFGDWGAWKTVDPCQKPPICLTDQRPSKSKKVKQRRSRPIIIEAKGNGKCGKSYEDIHCFQDSCRKPGWWESWTIY